MTQGGVISYGAPPYFFSYIIKYLFFPLLMIYREQPGRAASGEAARQGASADRRGLARFLPVSKLSAWDQSCRVRYDCRENDAGMGMIRQEGERVIHSSSQ